jgi:hypothetical protein
MRFSICTHLRSRGSEGRVGSDDLVNRRTLIVGIAVTLVHFAITVACVNVANSHDWPTKGTWAAFVGYTLCRFMLAPLIFVPSLLDSPLAFAFTLLNSVVWGFGIVLLCQQLWKYCKLLRQGSKT